MNYERKMAEIVRIKEVIPHPNADLLDIAKVGGWNVVVKKGDFSAGDMAIYFSIDSWIPHKLAPFLSNGNEPREYNGVKGERLRTVKLRNVISQGLLLKLSDIPRNVFAIVNSETGEAYYVDEVDWKEGEDLTNDLNIQKWEAPIPAQLVGQVRGPFPTQYMPKTDQPRIQSFYDEIVEFGSDKTYEKSMKIDGTSFTIFKVDNELRCCSRNLELKINEENANNTLIKIANEIGHKIPNNMAFQMEVYGEGIQGNKEKIKGQTYAIFDVYDIENQCYVSPVDRRNLCKTLELNHVPVLEENAPMPNSVEEALTNATGPSINSKLREGIVYKCNEDPSFSFKAISNEWIFKNGE
jgi:RNA ligase (TIGR02306 family)